MKTSLVKTNLLKSIVLVASLLGALGSASAETLHARIPFDFTAGGKAMPAGDYAIRTIPNAPFVLLFENESTKMQAIVFARHSSIPLAKPAVPMTFTSGASDGVELSNFASDEWMYELSVHPATKSLKGAALAITSSAK